MATTKSFLWLERSFLSQASLETATPPTSAQYQLYSLPTVGTEADRVLGKNRKTFERARRSHKDD